MPFVFVNIFYSFLIRVDGPPASTPRHTIRAVAAAVKLKEFPSTHDCPFRPLRANTIEENSMKVSQRLPAFAEERTKSASTPLVSCDWSVPVSRPKASSAEG